MNKKNKVIIAIGVIGLVLVCVGAVMGGSLSNLPTIFSDVTFPEGAVSAEEVNTDDVHSIEINLINSDITIETGENFRLTGSGLLAAYIKDGVLYGGATEAKHSTKIFGAKITASQKWLYGHGSYVLTIPKKAKLESIKINGSYCNITGDALNATNIEIITGSGDVTLNKVMTDNTTISAANLTITDIQALQNATITTSKDVTIGNDSMMENIIQNLSLSSTKGNITTFGKISGNSSISTEEGNITTTLSGASGNYTMRSLGGELVIGTEVGAEVSDENFGDISFKSKEVSNIHFK